MPPKELVLNAVGLLKIVVVIGCLVLNGFPQPKAGRSLMSLPRAGTVGRKGGKDLVCTGSAAIHPRLAPKLPQSIPDQPPPQRHLLWGRLSACHCQLRTYRLPHHCKWAAKPWNSCGPSSLSFTLAGHEI